MQTSKSIADNLTLLKKNKKFYEITSIGKIDSTESCDVLCEVTTSLASKLIVRSSYQEGANTIRDKLLQLIKYISLVNATKPNKKVLILFVTNGIYNMAKEEINRLLSFKEFESQILLTNIVVSFQYFVTPEFKQYYVANKLSVSVKDLKEEMRLMKENMILKEEAMNDTLNEMKKEIAKLKAKQNN